VGSLSRATCAPAFRAAGVFADAAIRQLASASPCTSWEPGRTPDDLPLRTVEPSRPTQGRHFRPTRPGWGQALPASACPVQWADANNSHDADRCQDVPIAADRRLTSVGRTSLREGVADAATASRAYRFDQAVLVVQVAQDRRCAGFANSEQGGRFRAADVLVDIEVRA
jgi:hypothetical protein